MEKNIIGLLLTLLAINTATLGLVASKIQDMLIQFPSISFKETTSEMKLSLYEQIVLIIISIVSMVISNSSIITFVHKGFLADSVLIAVLIYAVSILLDTGKSVFVIIDEIENLKKPD